MSLALAILCLHFRLPASARYDEAIATEFSVMVHVSHPAPAWQK